MTVMKLLPRVHVGAPIRRGALTMFPLWTEHPEVVPGYVPADSAAGSVTVSELEQPAVPQLVIDNAADRPALVLEGEMVAGGLQHRVLNVTVLLPAGQPTVVPVSCVEAGRWGAADVSRLAGRHSAPSVRRRKNASVAASMQHGDRHSDQSGVWEEVAQQAARVGTASATQSLMDAGDAARPVVEDLTRDLLPLPGQRGMIVGISGSVRGLELFDSAAVFAHYFRRLVDGFAAEAVGASEAPTSSSAARQFIRTLQHLDVREAPAVGLGTDLSASAGDLAALGLRVEDRPTPLHLAAFAA